MEMLEVTTENPLPQDQDKCFNNAILKEILKPLLLPMRWLGISYGDLFQSYRSSTVGPLMTTEMSMVDKKKTTKLQFCLCLFVSVVLVSYCVFSFIELVVVRNTFSAMTRLVIFLWLVLCACQQLTCLLTTTYCTKKDPLSRFQKFVKSLQLVRAENIPKHKKRIRTVMGWGWYCMILNTIVLMVALYIGNEEMRIGTRLMYFGMSNWTVAHFDIITNSYTAVHIFICASWVLPVCYYICLCLLVTGCFSDLFERTEKVISEKRPLNLVDTRQQYVRLCQVVSTLNDLLSPLGIINFAIYIPQVCLNINVCVLTFKAGNIVTGVAYSFWISCSFVILLVLSISGSSVNYAVRRLSEVLYDIDVSELDKKSERELMFLLSNLSTNTADITVGNVVSIDKKMILTVFGTILGYFTILVQFAD